MSPQLIFLSYTLLSLLFHPSLQHDLSSPMSMGHHSEKIKFFNMNVTAAIKEAHDISKNIKLHQSKSKNSHEKAVMSDCLIFYDYSIHQLNRILNPDIKSSPTDVDTWLSAALTNIRNCETRLVQENNIVSKLIISSLAINDQLINNHERTTHKLGYASSISNDIKNKFVVAQDGSGDFRTIKEALNASVSKEGRTKISVKQGTYNEYLEISLKMESIMLVGDGIGKTIITGSRSAKTGFSTYDSSTVKVFGNGFIARDITFRNTAGPDGGQAVALFSSSDLSTFHRCSFEGHQDTLWTSANRQFYTQCQIFGTVDFIFGNAKVVFQNSNIYARNPIKGQAVVITAQGRSDPLERTGISIINCTIEAAPEFTQGTSKVFLGRPWREASRTVYIKSFLDSVVDQEGWLDWDGKGKKDTVYFGEYENYGPGSSLKGRVNWAGFKKITDSEEAMKFSVENFIDGENWLPHTGVPYSPGL